MTALLLHWSVLKITLWSLLPPSTVTSDPLSCLCPSTRGGFVVKSPMLKQFSSVFPTKSLSAATYACNRSQWDSLNHSFRSLIMFYKCVLSQHIDSWIMQNRCSRLRLSCKTVLQWEQASNTVHFLRLVNLFTISPAQSSLLTQSQIQTSSQISGPSGEPLRIGFRITFL